MFRLKVGIALAMMLLASPAGAQGIFDDFFGPPPKPKTKPVKKPKAVKQPPPVETPAAVQQPGPQDSTKNAAKPAVPPSSTPKPAAPATVAKPNPAPAVPAPATSVARETHPPVPAAPKPAVVTPVIPPAAVLPMAPPAAVAPTPSAAPPAAPVTPVARETPQPAAPPVAPPAATRVAPAVVVPSPVTPAAPAATATAPAPAPLGPAGAPAQAAIPAVPPEPAAPTASASPPATQTAALDPGHMMPPKAKPANCKNTGNFPGWLAGFRKMAAADGVSQATISEVLDGMTLDQGIINRDRGGQKVFTQSFIDFSSKLANPSRYKSSVYKHNKLKAIFERAEAEFGVPGPVITAFWALESDFGTGMGNLPILRSLATLAYDCRRGEMFTAELLAALKLIDRGDMRPEEMVGSWAGEIGQTQFLPGHVLNYSIDYDGDGKRDLFRNNADIIGTSANFVKQLGWRAGEPWLQEVRLTKNLPWQEADLAIKHPLSQWTQWGVTQVTGAPLSEGPPASLILPMGRRGPAFLAYPNFDVYTRWNQSLVYALTAAHLATRVAGAPPMSRGDPDIPMLDATEVKELQVLMARAGLYAGETDGKLGAGTRAAVKQAQLKHRMPADSYPTPELLSALRGGGGTN